MVDEGQVRRFVRKVIRLTNADKMRWRQSPFCNWTEFKKWGFSTEKWGFSTEWLQDDRPTLWINNCKIEGYHYGIQALIQAIEEQYRRLKVGEYSDEETRKERFNADLAREAEAAHAERLNQAMDEFLQADN